MGSWWKLVDMINEAAEIDRSDQMGPPLVCPYDYTTLQPTTNGKLHCPWAGDYTYPDDGIVT